MCQHVNIKIYVLMKRFTGQVELHLSWTVQNHTLIILEKEMMTVFVYFDTEVLKMTVVAINLVPHFTEYEET